CSAIALTCGAYQLSRGLRAHWTHPLTTPLFGGSAIVCAVLLASNVGYDEYRAGAEPLARALGPLSAALAVPLYKNRHALGGQMRAALLALVAGSLTSLGLAIALGRLVRIPHDLLVPLGLKSSTSPIASELAHALKASTSLTIGFVVATGMLGAMFGPALLDFARIRGPLGRGLSLGSMAHVSGTATAYSEGETTGAVSGFAVGATGILMALAAPAILPWLTAGT
ncbi:MAG TPA: LrgB family protein, partial [Candidatus Baltobacteraceae bacterium]|nr:LrgB family protein [Candidatus Baltobacteraceae bacterium]